MNPNNLLDFIKRNAHGLGLSTDQVPVRSADTYGGYLTAGIYFLFIYVLKHALKQG